MYTTVFSSIGCWGFGFGALWRIHFSISVRKAMQSSEPIGAERRLGSKLLERGIIYSIGEYQEFRPIACMGLSIGYRGCMGLQCEVPLTAQAPTSVPVTACPICGQNLRNPVITSEPGLILERDS